MTEQYTVGKGKPPIKHQFKKGKSGNPSGRPKLPRQKPAWDFQKYLIDELKSPITIIEGDGKKKKISKKEALVKSFVADALKGDKEARKFMMNFLLKQPKYAFEDEEVVHTFRMTKSQMENTQKFVDLCHEYKDVVLDSDQEQANGSPSSLGPTAGSGSASTDT
jgi:Family of unknown function (DUF5681)